MFTNYQTNAVGSAAENPWKHVLACWVSQCCEAVPVAEVHASRTRWLLQMDLVWHPLTPVYGGDPLHGVRK
jgi:hypothetical protein